MATRADVLRQARGWLGTPWRHQGRLRGEGVDCVGVVVGVAHALGLSTYDLSNYRRLPVGDELMRLCDTHMQRLPLADMQPADVLLMRINRVEPQHLGIVGDHPHGLSLIHASVGYRKCVEHRLDDPWRARIVAAYRLPGVTDV